MQKKLMQKKFYAKKYLKQKKFQKIFDYKVLLLKKKIFNAKKKFVPNFLMQKNFRCKKRL